MNNRNFDAESQLPTALEKITKIDSRKKKNNKVLGRTSRLFSDNRIVSYRAGQQIRIHHAVKVIQNDSVR